MQLDFSGDGLPEPSFENAVDHDGAGFATVLLCGVPLRLRQSEILGGRLWSGGMRLALEIERGVALHELGEGREGAPLDGKSLEGKRVIELGAGCAGLPGVALALRHGMRVTLSEHPDVVPILRENILAVKEQVTTLASEGKLASERAEAVRDIRVVAFDWRDEAALAAYATDDDASSSAAGDASSAAFAAADATDISKAGDENGGFPLVIWADAGYFSDHSLLLRAAAAVCAPGGAILATESLRSEAATRGFRKAFGANGLFAVRVLGDGDLRIDETWTLAMEWQNRSEGRLARRAVARGTFDKKYGTRIERFLPPARKTS